MVIRIWPLFGHIGLEKRCDFKVNLNYKMIGKRIRRERKKRKLTQEQLAERANISASFMGHIERGTRKMSIETLCEISLVLDCATDELLGMGLLKADCRTSASELLALAQALANKRRL